MVMMFFIQLLTLFLFLHYSAGTFMGNKPQTHKIWKRQSEADWCANKSIIISQIFTHGSYSKHVPPTFPIQVKVEFWIQNAISVHMDSFEFDTYINEMWTDPRLNFTNLNPCNVNITLNALLTEMLWTPETTFADSKAVSVHEGTTKNIMKLLFANGTVWTSSRQRVEAPCNADLNNFPFDELSCRLTYNSLPYNSDKVAMHWTRPDAVIFLATVSLPDFIITNHTNERSIVKYPAGSWYELNVTFKLKRRQGWYFLHYYIPTSLILLASWLSVGLGLKRNGARILLYVGSLMAIFVLYHLATSSTPRVSYVTAASSWMLMCCGLLIGSILELAIVSCIMQSTDQYSCGKVCKRCRSGGLLSEGEASLSYRYDDDRVRGYAGYKGKRALVGVITEKVDKVFGLAILPLVFIAFNIWYWLSY